KTAGSGYVQQWNLAVQRSITNNTSVEVAYVGSHIVHVGLPDSNLNQLTAAQLAQGPSLLTQVNNPYFGQIPISSSIGTKTVSQAQLLKPYPRFMNVATYRNNSGTTNYNAVEAKVEQRFSHGIAFLFSYMHSKLIDDASSLFSSTVLSSPNSNSLVAADTFRLYLERDSSNGDMPNVTSFSGIYELPAGRGHRFASMGVGDPVRGPAYRDVDLALVKNVKLPLESNLQFRAEIFDVTNTPAFSQPNGSFGSAAFGSITSTTTDPRVVQFALRLSR